MTFRTCALAVAAAAALGLPAGTTGTAGAAPIPDPPPETSQTADMVRAVIDELTDDYRSSPVFQKRAIHEEIVLLINIGRSAL